MKDLIANPLLFRAAFVGVFGGVGLSLTSVYSRRGPLIIPVYAALLAALALLLARRSETSFEVRVAASFVGFTIATFLLYITVGILAGRQRRHLIAEGRLPFDSKGVSPIGHAWRWALVSSIGAAASVAVAVISG